MDGPDSSSGKFTPVQPIAYDDALSDMTADTETNRPVNEDLSVKPTEGQSLLGDKQYLSPSVEKPRQQIFDRKISGMTRAQQKMQCQLCLANYKTAITQMACRSEQQNQAQRIPVEVFYEYPNGKIISLVPLPEPLPSDLPSSPDIASIRSGLVNKMNDFRPDEELLMQWKASSTSQEIKLKNDAIMFPLDELFSVASVQSPSAATGITSGYLSDARETGKIEDYESGPLGTEQSEYQPETVDSGRYLVRARPVDDVSLTEKDNRKDKTKKERNIRAKPDNLPTPGVRKKESKSPVSKISEEASSSQRLPSELDELEHFEIAMGFPEDDELLGDGQNSEVNHSVFSEQESPEELSSGLQEREDDRFVKPKVSPEKMVKTDRTNGQKARYFEQKEKFPKRSAEKIEPRHSVKTPEKSVRQEPRQSSVSATDEAGYQQADWKVFANVPITDQTDDATVKAVEKIEGELEHVFNKWYDELSQDNKYGDLTKPLQILIGAGLKAQKPEWFDWNHTNRGRKPILSQIEMLKPKEGQVIPPDEFKSALTSVDRMLKKHFDHVHNPHLKEKTKSFFDQLYEMSSQVKKPDSDGSGAISRAAWENDNDYSSVFAPAVIEQLRKEYQDSFNTDRESLTTSEIRDKVLDNLAEPELETDVIQIPSEKVEKGGGGVAWQVDFNDEPPVKPIPDRFARQTGRKDEAIRKVEEKQYNQQKKSYENIELTETEEKLSRQCVLVLGWRQQVAGSLASEVFKSVLPALRLEIQKLEHENSGQPLSEVNKVDLAIKLMKKELGK
ncbi:hypothetical protein CI610_00172 [invertebrate metagenome]|uniref:Uncharacterized protein n=1 Tax=invertebrate metagenome TaxID=1711999 RepID=A0A2H9TCC0_9ZZZZ